MIRPRLSTSALLAVALVMAVGLSLAANAQERTSPAGLIAAQREAMVRLAFMDGAWRGSARTNLPSGEQHAITQTERVGPFLDGSVKVIEGVDTTRMARSPSTHSPPFLSTRRQRSIRCTQMRWATLVISC